MRPGQGTHTHTQDAYAPQLPAQITHTHTHTHAHTNRAQSMWVVHELTARKPQGSERKIKNNTYIHNNIRG